MPDPTVSIILPAYNAADVLGDAVDSVRQQTYTDYELIVADDGSTDETREVATDLAREFPAMRVLRLDHAGLAAARNRAIGAMRGQWIALLDADDVWLPTKLQRCMDYLNAHPQLSIVYTPMKPIRLDGAKMDGHSKPCHAGELTEKLFHSIFVHDPAVVFHKRVIETCGGFDEQLPVCVGHEFWLRVSRSFEFGLIDEPLAMRRWSEQSLTRGNRSRARETKVFVLERFYYDREGRAEVDAARAARRLAKVNYHAGKILLAEGRYRRARRYLAKALSYRRGYLRVYPLYLAAAALSPLDKSPPDGV